MKNVQIPYELFIELLHYHLVQEDDYAEDIRRGLEEKLDMEYAPRKIRMPKDYKEFPSFQVKVHHLDTNHHVNNGQYVLMAQEYIPADFAVKQMRAE